MSDNVELVRRCFAAYSAWDVESLLRIYHPDVELLPLTGTQVETGGYHGHDGVRAYMAEAKELWEVLAPDGHHFRDLGDRIVVVGTCRVRGRLSGAESNPVCAWVMDVRDGLIASHRACSTPDDAERMAGVEAGALDMSPSPEDAATLAKRLIDEGSYLTLGTADADGRPWVSPVWYAAAAHTELLWVSSPEARHSRNLADRPHVSAVIFDSGAPVGEAQAVYLRGTAAKLAGAELERSIAVFSRRSQQSGARPWTLEDVIAPARLRLYRASAREVFVLDSIGDTRQGDHRIPVEL